MTRLRRLLGQHPRLYGWLAADLVVLAAYGVCRENRAWMNAFASQVTGPLKEALGRLCYHTEISVMEVLAAALVIGAVLYILGSVVMVVRTSRERRGRRAWGAVLGALCTGLLIWDGFCLLWGVNYWTDSFQDLSGIYAQPVRQEDLTAVTAEFAQNTNNYAHVLTYLVNSSKYLRGEGFGTSYVGEAYVAFGIAGVIAISILIGVAFRFFATLLTRPWPVAALGLLAVKSFVYIPRSYALGWVTDVFNITYLCYILGLYLAAQLLLFVGTHLRRAAPPQAEVKA